jgi:redox-sensitive bicupin YhaK (pirin superfamily)
VPASGSVRVNGTVAATRDGLAIRDETSLEIVAQDAAELVMVEAAA